MGNFNQKEKEMDKPIFNIVEERRKALERE